MPCTGVKPYDPRAFSGARKAPCRFQESGVRFVIGGEDVACYSLDGGYFRPQDRCLCPASGGSGAHRCDGVLIGCRGEECYVIFLDLKKGAGENAVEQITDTICYFCRDEPAGARHHETWSGQVKSKKHKVVALVMNDKPPRRAVQQWGGKKIHWRSVGRKRAWASFEEFLSDIGPV